MLRSVGIENNIMTGYDQLYEIFGKYKKPLHIEACPCCLDENEINLLLSKQLKHLTAQELSPYASSVFLTVGSKGDFIYFFPRILELTLEEKFLYPDPEIVYRSISMSGWKDWPDNETDVVLKLSMNKFETLLNQNPDGPAIDQWLCAIAHIAEDLSVYLEKLESDVNIQACQAFVEWNISVYRIGKLDNQFWENCPDQARQVTTWMTNSEQALSFISGKHEINLKELFKTSEKET